MYFCTYANAARHDANPLCFSVPFSGFNVTVTTALDILQVSSNTDVAASYHHYCCDKKCFIQAKVASLYRRKAMSELSNLGSNWRKSCSHVLFKKSNLTWMGEVTITFWEKYSSYFCFWLALVKKRFPVSQKQTTFQSLEYKNNYVGV